MIFYYNKEAIQKHIYNILVGRNATFIVVLSFLLQIISLVTLYAIGTKNWDEDYYPPYISELASKIEIAPYFISLMFLANICGFIVIKYRYNQMAYFELSDRVNTFTLIIGQILLITNIALFLFPYHQKTRYHYFFTWTFFICANIYSLMNIYFLSKLRNELKHFVSVGTNFDVSRVSSIRKSFRHPIMQPNVSSSPKNESLDLLPMIGFKYLSESRNISMEGYSLDDIDCDCPMLEKLSIVSNNRGLSNNTFATKSYDYDNFTNLYKLTDKNTIAKYLLKKIHILLIIRVIIMWFIITVSFAQLTTNIIPSYIIHRNIKLTKYQVDSINYYYSISGVFEWIHCLAFALNIGLFSFEFNMKLPKKHYEKTQITYLIEDSTIIKITKIFKSIIEGNNGAFHAMNSAFLRLISLFIIIVIKKYNSENIFLIYSIGEMASDTDASCWYICCIYFSLISSLCFMNFNMQLINKHYHTTWADVIIFWCGICSVITTMAMYLFSNLEHPYMNIFISFPYYIVMSFYFGGDLLLKYKIRQRIPLRKTLYVIHGAVALILSLSGLTFIISYSIVKWNYMQNYSETLTHALEIAKSIAIYSEWVFSGCLIVGLFNYSMQFYSFQRLNVDIPKY